MPYHRKDKNMSLDEIINGLQFTIEMFKFDPSTGEMITSPRNDLDKITIDACTEAIKILNDLKEKKR